MIAGFGMVAAGLVLERVKVCYLEDLMKMIDDPRLYNTFYLNECLLYTRI